MKKVLSTILCAGLLSINLAYGADNLPQVKMNCTNIPLKTHLQEKYSAYRLDYINEGQNPVRVSEVKCYNRIGVANITPTNYKVKKSTIACLLLGIPTLGISTLFTLPDTIKQSNNITDAANEAKRFSAYDPYGTQDLKTFNDVLGQGQSIQFNVLVPLNEKVETVASFQDIVTNKYIRVEGTK